MNFSEMRTEAALQEKEKAEAFKEHLADEREKETQNNEEIQGLLSKLGARIKAETRATAETEINNAIEQAKTEIKAEYAQKHNVTEYDEQREPLRKMLRDMVGENK